MPKKRRRPSTLYLLLFLGTAVALFLYQAGYLEWLGLSPGAPMVTVSPGAWVEAHFTLPDFDDLAIHQGGLDALLAADIAAAREQVDVAAFDFDLESLTQALLQANDRGVQVRLVVDDENLEDVAVEQAMHALTAAGIPVVYDHRNAFMHNKFVVIDGEVVWTGSWNLTDNGTYRNNNNVLRLSLPQLAENYTVEFEEMFVDNAFGAHSPANTLYPVLQLSDGSIIETYFAPEENVRAAIIRHLREAEEEILFLAYSFTDDEIAQVLLEQAREGIVVRGVFEARGAQGEYSEYEVLRKAGLDVRLDGNPRVMHHKVIIVDGREVITGSYNFSQSAAEENDENLLIIQNADLGRSYREEFERVYRNAEE